MSKKQIAWTVDDFQPYVQNNLDKWKQDVLFMEIGLSEADTILKKDEAPPNKDDSDHAYNKILNLVIKDVALEFKLTKKSKKIMINKLRTYNETWEAMVKGKAVQGNEKSSRKRPTRASSSTEYEPKEREIKTKNEENGMADFSGKEASGINVDLTPNQLKLKKEFERKKQEIIGSLPEEVRSRFGQQYFSKWAKNSLPCLVLSPYNVPPGDVREMWLNMYDKVKQQGRLSSATNLVYWYGSYDDPTNAYSFVVTSKLIPYSLGEKKGMHKVPNNIQRKIDAGKKLTGQEKMLVEGLAEMQRDNGKGPDERHGRMHTAVLEDWEYDEEEEAVVEEVEEEEPKVKTKPKNLKKRKQPDSRDDEPKVPKKNKKSDNPKEKKAKKKAKSEKEVKKEKLDTATTEKVEDIEDIGDDDVSSEDDKDALEDAEIPSESDEDDEDFEVEQPKKPKKKASATKAAPKKKAVKTKTKIEKRVKDGKKKVPEGERKRILEQTRFTQCENKYLQIINDWKYGVENHSKGTITEIYERLLDCVEKFSASFIEAYEMPTLMKKSKKIVDNDNRVKLWNTMKSVYLEKKSKDVPPGFQPQKRVQKADVPKKEVKDKISQAEEKGETDTARATPKVPSKTKVNRQDSASAAVAPKLVTPSVGSEKKRKFSLGSIMTKPKTVTKSSAKADNMSRSTSSTQLSRRHPAWIWESSIKDAPADENRSFALEFLQQATPFIPPNEKVDPGVIARELEASIFRWAGGKEGVAVTDCFVKYWNKIDDVIAAISGDGGDGTIARLISQGRFQSASDVVQLSENDIACSYEGRPLEDFKFA